MKVAAVVAVLLMGLASGSPIPAAQPAAADERPASGPRSASRRPQRLGDAIREAIRIVPNLPYAETDNPRQRLDLFLPKHSATDSRPPLLVFIHGGGWQKGDRRSGLGILAPLVASGQYAGASIGYRLTDEARWPAQIHDCKAAIRWLRGNADRHGFNADRIAVIGTSAGGHLVAMLGTSGGVPELEGELGRFADQSSRVDCVIDFFGPSDLTTMDGWHDSPDSPEARLLGGTISEKQAIAREASPVHSVTSDDPPFLIIHGTADRVVPFDQSVELQRKLENAGATALLIPIQGGGHGRFRNQELERRISAFLENHLHGGNRPVAIEPIAALPRNR